MDGSAMDNEDGKLIQFEEKAILGNETPKTSVLQQVVTVCNVAGLLSLFCFAAYSLVSSFVSEPPSCSTQLVARSTGPSVIDPSGHLPPHDSPLPLVLMALALSTIAFLGLSPHLLQATDCIQKQNWSPIVSGENRVASPSTSLTDPVKGWAFLVAGTSLTILAALVAVSVIAMSGRTFPQANVIELWEGGARDCLRRFAGRIPGSKLKSAKEVAAARSALACLAQRGRWVFNPQPRPLPWNPGQVTSSDRRWCEADAHRLAGPEADNVTLASQWNIRTGLKYEWQPSKECGQWQLFQPASFCTVMKRLGGPLLMAGDSLTAQMHDSLHNMLQINESQKGDYMYTPQECKQWETRKLVEETRQTCRVVALCGPELPVLRVRNDRLTLVEGSPVVNRGPYVNGRRSVEYFLPWISLIEVWDAKAVLLNRGPHFAETPLFAKKLEETFRVLWERYPDLLILYRSSVAGHEGCAKFEVPLEKPPARDRLPFNWGEMHEQNGIAQRIVETYGGVFLDIEHMTELRADGHRRVNDCLHYCLPGPVDEWNRLLLNALSILL